MRRTVVLAGLMSVALCAAVMYAATPHDEEDAKLLSKVQKMGIVKHLKVSENAEHLRALFQVLKAQI
jgi:hypothetical protein